ncbi:MAG: PAS domain-containing protein [Gemmatimonas sp.]|nr:PAS domain-containing protein [Gemmatimonas sp.]
MGFELDGNLSSLFGGTLKNWLSREGARQDTEIRTNRTLDLLVAGARHAVLTWDDGGVVTRWNRAAEHLFGWSSSEVIGRLCPIVVAGSEASLAAVVTTGPLDREKRLRCRRSDGAELDLVVLVSAAGDGSSTDGSRLVTVVKRGKLEFGREDEASGVIARSPFGIIIAGSDGRILETNPAAASLLGRSEIELIGAPFLDLIRYPRGRVQQAVARGLSAGDSFESQVHLIRGDHDLVTVDLSIVSLDGVEAEQRIACFLMDATEQVAIEKRRADLLRLEQKARVAAEAAQRRAGHLARITGELTFSLDYDQTLRRIAELAVQGFASYCVVYVREGEGMLRVGAEAYAETDGPPLRHTTPTDPIPVPPESVTATTLETGHPLLLNGPEIQIDELFGLNEEHRESLRSFDLSSAMLLSLRARGTVHGAIAFFNRGQDATEFGEDDLRFAESLAQSTAFAIDNAELYRTAQRAVAAREELLAIVAHDLRSPLGAISVSTEMLQEFDLDENANHYHLEIIQRASARMSRLIQDLLDVAKIELRQLNIEPAPQEVLPILEEAHSLFETRARAKLLNFTYQVDPDASTVVADRYRVLQVLSNLIENAIKFSSPHGKIVLGVDRTEAGVLFTVTDEGPGIPPNELPHIFDRFWQARRTDESGAGLGLAIAKGIVEAHGGSIWVKSAAGEETRLGFSIPDPATVEVPPPKSASRVRRQGRDSIGRRRDRRSG